MVGVPGRFEASGDPTARSELVHQSARSRVTRLFLPGRTVIRKEPVGPDAERRLRSELAMLERLRGARGVAQLADGPHLPGSIVLADLGGPSLAEVGTPPAPDELVELAAALARAVSEVHARGVIHRNISPANIVRAPDGSPHLVGFGLATSLAEIRPEFTHHAEIVGALPYVAPEQTGRTARSIDQRADLYALGATLYELATGAPPFGRADPLRLTHDHLARVPVPPTVAAPAVPAALSAIVMHLLEKEPDNRYQTAAGVLHDLEALRRAGVRASAAALRIGEHDVPLRLLPPSRLVGRDADVTALRAAFEAALAGECRGVLVSGPPGVGKTALVDELRAVVTGSDGWFVAGKFDEYRRDLESDAVNQAFRALGRLLLAEPEDQLSDVREHILQAAGPNAGQLTATLPEFAVLLAVPPDPGDPLTAQVRTQRTAVQVLRAVASRQRPLVLFLDDLQWAGRPAVGLVDLLLGEEQVEGLLLVAAYREHSVAPAHPLAAPLSRWRNQPEVRHLALDNLPVPALTGMVAEMLHVNPSGTADLVEAIEPHTSGNPYETVELLNALRRDGLLTATSAGWRWDAAAVREQLGESERGALLAGGVEDLPGPSRQLVEAMACLAGRAELSLLQTAVGVPHAVLDEAAAPALEDGLLVVEPGVRPALRFRHDRIREDVLLALSPQRRRDLHLAMARRLATAPALAAVAAEQYLPEVEAIGGTAERRVVVELMRRAADEARLTGDYARVHVLLSGALALVEPGDDATLLELHVGRHAALYSLGRLDEADAEFRTIAGLRPSVLGRVDATAVQVISLTHRKCFGEALDLGIGLLGELGITATPAERLPAALDREFADLNRWLTEADGEQPGREITDPTVLAATSIINATLPAAYYSSDLVTYGWLSLEALRILVEHGVSPTVLGAASQAVLAGAAVRDDYATAYRALGRFVELGEARRYEPETSQARLQFADVAWRFAPVERGVQAGRHAREGLIAGGDLANAGYTFHSAVLYLVDCAPSIERWAAEVEAGLAFLRRTGSEQTAQWLEPYRWLAGLLRGEIPVASAAAPVDKYADNRLALLLAHIATALAAAVFGDPAGLTRHSAAAMPALPATLGLYPDAVAHVLRGLALAREARATAGGAADRALSELDAVTRWAAARAADAPDNLLHLQRLLEAERAWATGDFQAAALGFDAARREVSKRRRPWHRALIAESAARFYLAHGLEAAGFDLLGEARQQYLAWGATAKVSQLDWAYPTLPPAADAQPGDVVSTGTIDLLGLLSASQALSSETEIERLHARLVRVLCEITGATGVHLLLWDDESREWLLPAGDRGDDRNPTPMSVLRYVQRVREPLLVADAAGDERFAGDPYFAGRDQCSLLGVPILGRGALRAVLLLENRLIRGAFTAERLEAVTLIAGQLAVSLDNARLYSELKASRARIVTSSDEARRQIARDLHDGAQQSLVSAILNLKAAQADADAATSRELLAQGLARAEHAIGQLRELAHGILPGVLRHGGLRPAVGQLMDQLPMAVDADVTSARLPPEIEANAYFVIAEALTNAAKHSGARRVEVSARVQDGVLHVEVTDDGVGGARRDGSGLLGLADRVAAFGGSLEIESPTGAGTRIAATLRVPDDGTRRPVVPAVTEPLRE